MMHKDGKSRDGLPDPEQFDMSQTDLFGQRVTAASVRYHRSIHKRGLNTTPESTPDQS